MTIDQWKRALKATPFRAFKVHLADGRNLTVSHSEFVATSPTGETAVVFQPDGDMDIIDLMLVTSLEFNGVERKTRAKRKESDR